MNDLRIFFSRTEVGGNLIKYLEEVLLCLCSEHGYTGIAEIRNPFE